MCVCIIMHRKYEGSLSHIGPFFLSHYIKLRAENEIEVGRYFSLFFCLFLAQKNLQQSTIKVAMSTHRQRTGDTHYLADL
jgi:hypothetical protein